MHALAARLLGPGVAAAATHKRIRVLREEEVDGGGGAVGVGILGEEVGSARPTAASFSGGGVLGWRRGGWVQGKARAPTYKAAAA